MTLFAKNKITHQVSLFNFKDTSDRDIDNPIQTRQYIKSKLWQNLQYRQQIYGAYEQIFNSEFNSNLSRLYRDIKFNIRIPNQVLHQRSCPTLAYFQHPISSAAETIEEQ